MDYITQDDILLVLRQSGSPQTPRLLFEVLDLDGNIVGEIEGVVSGTLSISAESDIRRTGSVVIQPTRVQNITLQEGNNVWLDREIHMKLGLYDIRSKSYVWYSMGWFIYTDASITYDAVTNQLTANLSDFMAKLDGSKNGNVGHYSITFAAKPGDYDYYGGTLSYSNNAYSCTISNYLEYYDEYIGARVSSTNSSAAPTLNINNFGALPILSYRTGEGIEPNTLKAGCVNIFRVETITKNDEVQKNIYFDSYLEQGETGQVKVPSVIRNVVIEIINQFAPWIGSNYIIDDIGAPRGMPQYNPNGYLAYRTENEGLWNTVPYDQVFNAGATVLQMLAAFRDLYANYEMYFDAENNTFICQMVPSCLNDDNFIENEFIQRLLISESTNTPFTTIRNVCEVWGETFEVDFYGTNVSYSGNCYTCTIEGYEDAYYNGDMVALDIPSTNSANASINLNGFGAIPIYNESTNLPITAGVLSEGTYTFKITKKRNSQTSTDVIRAVLLGKWQVHALNVLTDGSTSTKTVKLIDGKNHVLYSEDYFKVKYNCNRVDFEVIPESPFTVQKLGEILDVKTGGEFENITSDDGAAYRAKIENYKNCRLTDNVSITTALMPYLDVNKKVTYKPYNDTQEHYYIIKSISHDFAGFTSSITMMRFYEEEM